MIRKDLIDRHMEEFGKFLARLRSLLMKKENEQFEKELQEAFLKYTSVKAKELLDLDENAFDVQVVKNSGLSQDEKKMIADLLFEKLHQLMEISDSGADPLLKKKCQNLYNELLVNSTANEYNLDAHYKVKYLELL